MLRTGPLSNVVLVECHQLFKDCGLNIEGSIEHLIQKSINRSGVMSIHAVLRCDTAESIFGGGLHIRTMAFTRR